MQARRRRLAAASTALGAILGLTACEQPTPLVSLYSGGTTLQDRAFSFCFPGQDPQRMAGEPGACRYDSERKPLVLQVRPGDSVLIDVDKDLADAAWFATLRVEGKEGSRIAVQEEHTGRIQPDFNQGPQQFLEVRKLDRAADDAQVVGLWLFVVVPG